VRRQEQPRDRLEATRSPAYTFPPVSTSPRSSRPLAPGAVGRRRLRREVGRMNRPCNSNRLSRAIRKRGCRKRRYGQVVQDLGTRWFRCWTCLWHLPVPRTLLPLVSRSDQVWTPKVCRMRSQFLHIPFRWCRLRPKRSECLKPGSGGEAIERVHLQLTGVSSLQCEFRHLPSSALVDDERSGCMQCSRRLVG
jgi:hypothetical protein